ncbi:FAD-dependent oxidoreductase [Mesorhizobium sp. L-8-3]|uniref:FAD-dependent oxidoreductase n=1 Tax=Mesorhizobium sp. L-8-3 TaxID=2744522 RepID=UPI001935E8B1|nr:FAD-dependent oxidoreductase [Mesorhizobium sp. L-8-3]BCH20601.1 fumarate reductase flavoprotein subunit [Mesorhizobium sp. L-8-3]
MEAGAVSREPPPRIDASADVVVIGAGACGLAAALKAGDAGADVLVLERDGSASGSTSMSSGFVPAPATRFQWTAGIEDDTPDRFLADIMAKSHGSSHARLAALAARTIGPALEWLADRHGLEWIVLDDFLYPGHSRHRMHAVPEKTGAALLARMQAATERAGIPVVCDARAVRLFVDDLDRVRGVELLRPDGAAEIVGCGALVLACNGYGGSRELVARHIPEIAGGLYYGHAGNTGDALTWGEALGADVAHLSAYQGHGSLAHPHGILISWALMTKGAIQVNTEGRRFSDESGGYSEQAVCVVSQPGGVAWNVYDQRIHDFALAFPDYRDAVAAGAVIRAADLSELARATHLPEAVLQETFIELEASRSGRRKDAFGRDFSSLPPFEAPFCGVRVTGALFHTQGGLVIDDNARVVRPDGAPFPNLFAGGGAACGVSGPNVSGYLSGNGLLTALAFGFLAGEGALDRSLN